MLIEQSGVSWQKIDQFWAKFNSILKEKKCELLMKSKIKSANWFKKYTCQVSEIRMS